MSESKKHRDISERIAKRDGVEYNSQKGPDIARFDRVTEVEIDPSKVKEGISQVARFQRSRYVAGPAAVVKEALIQTKGTGIGVRDQSGNIVKRARRSSN